MVLDIRDPNPPEIPEEIGDEEADVMEVTVSALASQRPAFAEGLRLSSSVRQELEELLVELEQLRGLLHSR